MISPKLYTYLLSLLHREVKPALGCTEPIAVALAVAKASEILREHEEQPVKVTVEVSSNILKNAMGVGIPGTGMNGLYIASALGVTCGNSAYGLEVLKEITPECVKRAVDLVNSNRIEIKIAQTEAKLYVKAFCWSLHHVCSVVIAGKHDFIAHIVLDGKTIFEQQLSESDEGEGSSASAVDSDLSVTIASIYEFAMTASLNDIAFIKTSAILNHALAEEGLNHKYGLQVGKTIINQNHILVFGDGLLSYAMALTAAAADARMDGCTLPAMSNSGSGNQGITVTMPVVATAERLKCDEEKLIRALTLSHLIAIHIKSYLGRLSALCGCVVASSGASCGITYLMGGGLKEIVFAIKNMIGNITGMVCDGAKAGCALKVSSGTSSAIQSAILAIDGICISNKDGIIDDDIEQSISNLGKVGSVGMQNADSIMLNIMINK